ncbi:DUF5790 family protein [Halococcus hamelinensis]|uniref:Uncharacterized protein n=1 Tax=Halococcus hamelinensis 100A6 TaxID=1132509 RepID=M0M7U9_9EURY|nr:DUF5790 family protein [Halococcus hamelinensis]EMA41438.1 hypothetical protein C447_01250 [Halococcus hamelinensis 100A6]
MSQSTFEDDDLFDEAADDIRSDVEERLDAVADALPDGDAIWSVEADNTLGVLNSLRSALDVDDAAADLREAKKWYAMGKRAEVFDDSDDLEARIETLDGVLTDVEEAHEQASGLASTVPELRGALDETHDGESGDAEESEADEESDEADAEEGEAEAAE